MPEPIRAIAYEFSLTLVDSATGGLRPNPTLAAGDFQVSQDHGALANLTTLPTVAPAGSALVRVQLSATEMTVTQQVDVVAHDPDGQWDDVTVQIQPTRTLGTDFKTLLSAEAQTGVVLPRVTLVDTLTTYTGDTPQSGDAFARLGVPAGASVSADVAAVDADTTALLNRLTALRAGFLDNLGIGGLVASQASVDAVTAKTDGLPPDPADASVLAASFSALSAELATIASYIDTEVAAIKARTDTLPPQPAAVGSPMTLAAGAVTAIALAAAACEKLADILARRHTSAIEASADGAALDINSLYGALAMGTGHKRDTTTHAGALTVYRSNGVAELAQVPLVTDEAAEPIVAAGG